MSNVNAPKVNFGITTVYRTNTHADFLNEAFGTNYKSWGKCYWPVSQTEFGWFAWFVRIDGKSRDEFKNIWIDKDTILHSYVGTTGKHDGGPLEMDVPGVYRLVFEIIVKPNKKYVFQGVFLMDRGNSTAEEMILKKVSDVFPIK